MNCWNSKGLFHLCTLTVALLSSGCVSSTPAGSGRNPVLLVVMDPLARELACACVKGFGQRDYRKLVARLEAALSQRISIEFSDDLAGSIAQAGPGQEVIIIGDQSVVTHGAKQAGLKCHPVCQLTGLDGETT